jgi:type IV secretory pathway VirB10-like protein
MRAGFVVSLVGHVGAVMMTMLAWEARTTLSADGPVIVPVEIVAVAEESNVRALAEQVPEEEIAAAETPPEPEPPQTRPTPTPAPTPPPRERRRADEFDLSDISGLIDKQRETGRRRQDGAPADRTQRSAGLGTAEVASMEARIASLVQRHLQRCWRLPDDLPDPDRLIVVVEFQLNRNGTLDGQPRVTSPRNYSFDAPMNEAVNRAVRAVRQCDPYPLPDDPIVGEHFDIWREQEVTFRRRL